MKVPPDILSFLKKEDGFFIATHINPEPDALGSSLALSTALESMGKRTIVFDRDTVPEFYRFLPGHERFVNSTSQIETSSYHLVLLDCNTPDRAGIDGLPFLSSAVIDHHETEKGFGDISWVVPGAAATGIMVFYLIKELGASISREIAMNLYAAIAIDTGTFRYSNTSAEVLRVAAELMEAGADPAFVSTSLYDTWTEDRFCLLILVLDSIEIRDSIAFTHVTKEMFEKTGTGPEDTENFANFPRVMKQVKVSAFFRQVGENHWKASLRSKGDLSVAGIAASFGGGGHKNAAGYTFKGTLEDAKEALLVALKTS
ncbi:MAG: bifunctional oligoribonuclease/PAP phosphatase NrnA [Nitrospirota bacterium]